MNEHSPAPGTPQTPAKAFTATALSVVAAFVIYWLGDSGDFTRNEIMEAFLASLAAGGVTGVGTYKAKNKAR